MRIRERFNPRAPCGARPSQQNEPRMSDLFQPTCLLRGATVCRRPSLISRWNFNPRAPCGARRANGSMTCVSLRFQPTRPLRGATQMEHSPKGKSTISTHAPLAGRDVGDPNEY